MNDEIKEILDRIETASEIFDCLLKPKECTELLDYITNLQQRSVDIGEYNTLVNEYNEIYKENERLNEDIEMYKKELNILQNGSENDER